MDETAAIRACLEGNREAFQTIIDAYGSLALAVAINVLGNRQDAEDACQEAFLQVFRNLTAYDPSRSLKTWLLTIVTRRCLDMRKKKVRFSKFFNKAKCELPVAAVGGTSNPVRREPLPSRLLEGLSPKERTALCLWANEGYTPGEIAEVLRVSDSTARVYLFHARRKVKSAMEKCHDLLSAC